MAVLGSGGSLSRLAQQAPEEAIAFGRATGIVLSSALLGTRTNTDPGSQLRGRGEGRGLRTDLGQDFLRGFSADARNLDQTRHCVLILLHLSCRQLAFSWSGVAAGTYTLTARA